MASASTSSPSRSSRVANLSEAVTQPAPTIVLLGVPEGLEARPVYRYRTSNDGDRVPVKTRRGLQKFDRVMLVAGKHQPAADAVMDEREKRFILGAQRRVWRSIESRYGQDAWSRCIELARANVVELRCDVAGELELGQLVDWQLTPSWSRMRSERVGARKADRDLVRQGALEVADSIDDICPEFARVLRNAPPHMPALPAVIAVARDLRDGLMSASPRAFSQRHFGSTKAHDGVAHVLERLGVPSWVADATGVRRSSRIGVAGQIVVDAGSERFRADAFAGPVTLRANQAGLRLLLTSDAVALILVENLQAAEALADARGDLAIVYTGGMPGHATLDRIGEIASRAAETLIATDADLGGVRIAEQLLEVTPKARLIDVGTVPHDPQPPWSADSAYRRSLERTRNGSAGNFADAVLERGYPLEQELLLVDAVALIIPRSAAQPLSQDSPSFHGVAVADG